MGTEAVPCPTSISKANMCHLAAALWEHHFPLALKSAAKNVMFGRGKGNKLSRGKESDTQRRLGNPGREVLW